MNKTICIMAISDLSWDIRVRKHIRNLKDLGDVTVVDYGPSRIGGIKEITLSFPEPLSFPKKIIYGFMMFSGHSKSRYWRENRETYEVLKDKRFDLFIANNLIVLPLAIKLAEKNNAKVILDAHEYSPLEWANRFYWKFTFQKFYNYIGKKYLTKLDHMFTVCEGIAEKYKEQFGVGSDILMNVPNYTKIDFKSTPLDKIKLIHHGDAIPDRKMEVMIEMMKFLDKRYELHFMLLQNNTPYLNKLKKLAIKISPEKIFFHKPVSPDIVITKISQFDIGLYLLIPNNFNDKFALPNKFFDFIMAGLAIAIGPSWEMKKIVKKYNCGVISSDFSAKSLANKLNSLTPKKIDGYKRNSLNAAKILNADSEWQKLTNVVEDLLKD